MPRRTALVAWLGALAGCVTTTVYSTRFPSRAGWQSCVRDRLTSLGYHVPAADTAASRLSAARGGVRLTVAVDSIGGQGDAPGTPTLRLEARGTLPGSDVDSLVIYCSALSPTGSR